MAPTGTISAPLGCYDAGPTSIEPDYTLVKWKQRAGGGSLKTVSDTHLMALHDLGEKAVSFTGAQAGITTFGSHTRGRIHNICLLYTSRCV